MRQVDKKVARPSFLDKPKQQQAGPAKDYQAILFEETNPVTVNHQVSTGGGQQIPQVVPQQSIYHQTNNIQYQTYETRNCLVRDSYGQSC